MSRTQDLRFIRTNQLLVDAFTELLSQKKFEDITVNELCEKALVRRATFYTHFLDKYDFFAYFIQQYSDIFSSQLDIDHENCDPDTFFLHMSSQLVVFLNRHLALVENVLNSNAFPILLSILSEQIRTDLKGMLSRTEGIKECTEIQMDILASFYAGGLIQIVHGWISQKKRLQEDELIRQIHVLLDTHPMIGQNQVSSLKNNSK